MSTASARAAARTFLRDFVIDGVPASGANEPSKSEGRATFALYADAIDSAAELAEAGVRFATQTIRVRSTANVAIASALENGDTLNGVTLATGDHVFLGSQTAPAENGLYTVVASGAASRATFADSAAELARIGFLVVEGTAGAGERWTLPMDVEDITLGSTALVFARIAVEVDYAARLDVLEGQGVIVGELGGGSTAGAYEAEPRVGAVSAYSAGQLYVFTPAVTNTASPTLAVGTGPAKQITGPTGAAMPAGFFTPNKPVIVLYESGSGGFFRVVSAYDAPALRMLDVASGTGDAVVAASSFITPLNAYTPQTTVMVKWPSDATVATPTLNVDGLGAVPIYDPLAALVDTRVLRAGTYAILRYSTAFGGLWQLVSPLPAPKYSAGALEGLQRADETAAGVRALREELLAASVLTPVALNPTPIYSNTFTVAPAAGDYTTAHGTGPNSTPSYDDLVHNAGGYIQSNGIAEPGDDSWWWDSNHVGWGPGMLQLLATVGCLAHGGPLPNIPDMRNIRVTFELEVVNLFLPYMARLVFHWQGMDLDVADGGTGKAVNFHWHEPLDVALGSLGGSKGAPPEPNSGTGRMLNGSATFNIDFVPSDAYWRCIGTSEGRADDYAFAPVERVMRAALTDGDASSYMNMHIQVVHPQQYGGNEGVMQAPAQRAYGALRIKSFEIKEPV